jgi:hypothetical protein
MVLMIYQARRPDERVSEIGDGDKAWVGLATAGRSCRSLTTRERVGTFRRVYTVHQHVQFCWIVKSRTVLIFFQHLNASQICSGYQI